MPFAPRKRGQPPGRSEAGGPHCKHGCTVRPTVGKPDGGMAGVMLAESAERRTTALLVGLDAWSSAWQRIGRAVRWLRWVKGNFQDGSRR